MSVTQPQTMREFFQAVGNVQDHGAKEYISPNYNKTSNCNHLQNNGQLGTFYAFFKKKNACTSACSECATIVPNFIHLFVCLFSCRSQRDSDTM